MDLLADAALLLSIENVLNKTKLVNIIRPRVIHRARIAKAALYFKRGEYKTAWKLVCQLVLEVGPNGDSLPWLVMCSLATQLLKKDMGDVVMAHRDLYLQAYVVTFRSAVRTDIVVDDTIRLIAITNAFVSAVELGVDMAGLQWIAMWVRFLYFNNKSTVKQHVRDGVRSNVVAAAKRALKTRGFVLG